MSTLPLRKPSESNREEAIKQDIGWYVLISIASCILVIPTGPFTLMFVVAVIALPVSIGERGFSRGFALPWTCAVFVTGVVAALLHPSKLQSTFFVAMYPFALGVCALFLIWAVTTDRCSLSKLALAISVGLALGYVLQRSGEVASEPLKGGLGVAISVFTFGWLYLREASNLQCCFYGILLSVFFAISDARNFAACALIVTLLVCARGYLASLKGGLGLRAITMVLIAGAGAGLASAAYDYGAGSGLLGSAVESRHERQSSDGRNLLFAARPELAVSYVAIKSEPLLGRGGKPEANGAERAEALNLLSSEGNTLSNSEIRRILGRGINSHSVIFSSWIALGVAGAGMWIVFIVALWLGVAASANRSAGAFAFSAYAASQTSWDLLFSPWNARFEVLWGLYFAVAVIGIISDRRLNSHTISSASS